LRRHCSIDDVAVIDRCLHRRHRRCHHRRRRRRWHRQHRRHRRRRSPCRRRRFRRNHCVVAIGIAIDILVVAIGLVAVAGPSVAIVRRVTVIVSHRCPGIALVIVVVVVVVVLVVVVGPGFGITWPKMKACVAIDTHSN
jgi:transposase